MKGKAIQMTKYAVISSSSQFYWCLSVVASWQIKGVYFEAGNSGNLGFLGSFGFFIFLFKKISQRNIIFRLVIELYGVLGHLIF